MANNSNMILKAIAVLRAFTDEQAVWGVNELSRHMGIPVSSLHRILKSFREEGILTVQPHSNKYSFGPEFIRMASIVHSKSDIKLIARPIIEQLSDQLDETIYLSLYFPQKHRLAFVDHIQSSKPLQYMLELGIHYPIHIAASGKAILAFLPQADIEMVVAEEQLDAKEAAELIALLQQIRQQGYAESSSERRADSVGIGCPLFDATGNVIGSIICAIPQHVYEPARKPIIIQAMMNTANQISKQLGYNEL